MKALLLIAVLALPVAAQEDVEPATTEQVTATDETSSDSEEQPDYTPRALTLALEDLPLDDDTADQSNQGLELLSTEQWTVRLNMINLPLEDTWLSGPIVSKVYSPFSLLGMEFPPAGSAGDEWAPDGLTWRQRRYRWRMVRVVNADNLQDNSIFEINVRR